MEIPNDRGGPAEAGPGMAGSDRAENAALWRRWQALAPADETEAPDFLEMAAFAEGGAAGPESERVERWLASRPELIPERLGDIVAARAAGEAAPEAPSDRMLTRAMELVAGPADGVVPLRPMTLRVAYGWRGMVARGGIAASLAATSLLGFALGDNAWTNLLGGDQTVAYQDPLDAPTGIFTGLTEDDGI